MRTKNRVFVTIVLTLLFSGYSIADSAEVSPGPVVLDGRHLGMFVGRQPIDFTFYDMAIFDGGARGKGSTYDADEVVNEVMAQKWWNEIHEMRLAGQYQLNWRK